MRHHEPDVLAVRSLAEEPTDESVTRAWYRITQLEAKRHNVSRRRFLIPVAAGVALTVLAGGTAFYLTRGGDDGGQYLSGTQIEIMSALDALAYAAERTEKVTVPSGKLIHSKAQGWATTFSSDGSPGEASPQDREMWFDPNGGIALKITSDGTDMTGGAKADNYASQIAEARQHLADKGPGVRQPTPQWLAGLPTDPAALLTELRRSTGTHESWSVDQQLWDAMAGLYYSHEIALSPTLRAALLRSFKGIDDLAAREIVLDGRALIAVRFVEKDSGHEILFDPASGRAVGRSSLYFGNPIALPSPNIAVTGPLTDPNVTYATTWTQEIVDPL